MTLDCISLQAFCQATDSVLMFEDYDPKSTLVVKEAKIIRAKYPFIDIHNHQPFLLKQDLDKLVSEMDKLYMRI